jgi:hypothetical protein
LYFSCKNYKELAQARITKVVGSFTTNPTKLLLHFYDVSTIFYAICKNQPNHKYYLSYPFAEKPSRRFLVLQCGPLGRPAGAGCRNSASSPAFLAGRGRGEGLGLLGTWFGVLDRAERLRRAARRRPGRDGRCGCPAPASGGSESGEESRLASVDVRVAIGGADRRGEPAEERRTVEAGGGSGRSGAQGGGGAWAGATGLYMRRGHAGLGPVDRRGGPW